MLAAHILLHALLSLSLPGPSGSHREENVVDVRLRTVLIVKMNIFTQKLSLSISGASCCHQYDGCHPSLGR